MPFISLDSWSDTTTLSLAARGATFLLNSPWSPEEVWDRLPRPVQQVILDKELKFFVVDAYSLARELGLGVRINTIMQAAFFALSGILPPDEATQKIKDYISKTYGKRGEVIVRRIMMLLMLPWTISAKLSYLHRQHQP